MGHRLMVDSLHLSLSLQLKFRWKIVTQRFDKIHEYICEQITVIKIIYY